MKLLLVEDDSKTANYLVRGLQKAGHVVTHSVSGQDGLSRAIGKNFDLLIVERGLPVLDGFSLVKALRAIQVETPVLFLSPTSESGARMTEVNVGGDDYLVKPFALDELLARVEALGQRPRCSSVGTHFKVADLELDLLKRVVKRAGHEIALQPREFHLLEYLMRHAGQVVTRDMLLNNVWSHHLDTHTNIVESHLSRLRTKLNKGFSVELIHTVRGIGYCLRAPE